jgi:hypothetical protein
MQRAAKQDGVPLVRLQYDRRHVADNGVAIEVCGPAPEWVVEAIDRILTQWREQDAAERSAKLH